MIALKPCPFCGGKVRLSYNSKDKRFSVRHLDIWNNCSIIDPIQISGVRARSLLEAEEEWNRRVSNE